MTEKEWSVGWFGKLPCVGDFIRSGLSPQFISNWDGWMQAMMASGREALGEAWQTCYMEAPIWRFALPQHVCGPHPVSGIVMPSVDRVGRHYPFCLAMEGPSQIRAATAWDIYQRHTPLYELLESIALAMLEDGASVDGLQAALSAFPKRHESAPPVATFSVGNADLIAQMTSVQSQLANLAVRGGETLWVAAVGPEHRTILSRGMPDGRDLAATLFNLHDPVWQTDDEDADLQGVEA